jgi:sporulation protein YlmC with PRC-barrel domain
MRDYDRNYDTMTRDSDERPRGDFRSGRREESGSFFGRNDDGRSQARYGNREASGSRDRNYQQDYGPDQHRRGIPRDETERLIASDKVEGTPVYGQDGDKLGSIHNFMVEKRSGKVVYAVMKTHSGFLGLDERFYPLDWDELTYDTRVDGYHVDMTKDDLERRRSFDSRGRRIGIGSGRDREMGSYRRDYEDRHRFSW